MKPKISALISLMYKSGSCASEEKLATNEPGVPCSRYTKKK